LDVPLLIAAARPASELTPEELAARERNTEAGRRFRAKKRAQPQDSEQSQSAGHSSYASQSSPKPWEAFSIPPAWEAQAVSLASQNSHQPQYVPQQQQYPYPYQQQQQQQQQYNSYTPAAPSAYVQPQYVPQQQQYPYQPPQQSYQTQPSGYSSHQAAGIGVPHAGGGSAPNPYAHQSSSLAGWNAVPGAGRSSSSGQGQGTARK
jgi:hypothetical protein